MHRLLSVSLLCSAPLMAEVRYVPGIDASGRLITIEVPDDKDKAPAAAAEPQERAKSVQPSSPEPVPATPAAQPAFKTGGAVDKLNDAAPYMSSEELEEKGFRPDGKKRFYYLPDGSMGKTPIETEDSVPVWVQPPAPEPTGPEGVRLSPEYLSLTVPQLGQLQLPVSECLGKKALRKARELRGRMAFHVSPPLNPEDSRPDVLIKLVAGDKDSALLLVSHAARVVNPAFYVPVAVFHDADGCALGGAWRYWTGHREATEVRFESVEGVLAVTSAARYMSLHFPVPAQIPDIPFAVQREGAFTLETYE